MENLQPSKLEKFLGDPRHFAWAGNEKDTMTL